MKSGDAIANCTWYNILDTDYEFPFSNFLMIFCHKFLSMEKVLLKKQVD